MAESNILEQMRMGTDYRFPVVVRNFRVLLRPLTVIETTNILSDTQAETSRGKTQNEVIWQVIFSIKTLTKASTTSPDSGDPQLTEYTLQSFTPDELSYLFKEYVAVCDRVNPSLDQMPAEKLAELVEYAKKNPSQLIELSFLEVVNLCRHLLADSPADKSHGM